MVVLPQLTLVHALLLVQKGHSILLIMVPGWQVVPLCFRVIAHGAKQVLVAGFHNLGVHHNKFYVEHTLILKIFLLFLKVLAK
jgi:hypothetical protein